MDGRVRMTEGEWMYVSRVEMDGGEVRGRGGVEVGRDKGGARRRSWSDINTIDGEHE